MDKIEIFKALSNETRLSIIEWLKEPEKNFPPQGGHFDDAVDLKGGVCVGSIRDKAGISQSTVSHYLDMLQKAGLPVVAPNFGADRYLALMAQDKKVDSGAIKYILMRRLGESYVGTLPESVVRAALAAAGIA